MISFLTLPIRLVVILLVTAFLFNVMAPLRSLELKLGNINAGTETSVIAKTAESTNDGSTLFTVGLSLIAIVSIWMIYQTYRQHIGLAVPDARQKGSDP